MRKSTLLAAWKRAISPGELLDKMTILLIKLKKVVMPIETRQKVLDENIACWNALQSHIKDQPKKDWTTLDNLIVLLYNDLYKINKVQWDYEDGVRESKGTEESGKYAVLARENNNKRVAKKNEINKLFGIGCEIKKYSGEDKEEDKEKDNEDRTLNKDGLLAWMEL